MRQTALFVVAASWTIGSVCAQECVLPPNETCEGAVVFTTDDLPFEFEGPLGCVNDIPDKPFPHANKASLSRKLKNWFRKL